MLKRQQERIKRLEKKIKLKKQRLLEKQKILQERLKTRRGFAIDPWVNLNRIVLMRQAFEFAKVRRSMMKTIIGGNAITGNELARYISTKSKLLKSKIRELKGGKRDGGLVQFKESFRKADTFHTATQVEQYAAQLANQFPAVVRSKQDQGLEEYVQRVVLMDRNEELQKKASVGNVPFKVPGALAA